MPVISANGQTEIYDFAFLPQEGAVFPDGVWALLGFGGPIAVYGPDLVLRGSNEIAIFGNGAVTQNGTDFYVVAPSNDADPVAYNIFRVGKNGVLISTTLAAGFPVGTDASAAGGAVRIGTTRFYYPSDSNVLVYDLVNLVSLGIFTSKPGFHAFRVLFYRSGNCIIGWQNDDADHAVVHYYDTDGNVLGTYDAGSNLGDLAIDPNEDAFWMTGNAPDMRKIRLSDMTVVATITSTVDTQPHFFLAPVPMGTG